MLLISLSLLLALLMAGCSLPFSRSLALKTCSAAKIPLEAGHTRKAEGCLHLHLDPGDIWEQDGYDLASRVGYREHPACDGFFLTLSWKVTNREDHQVVWTVVRQDQTLPVGGGAEGQFRFGCGLYQLHNKYKSDPLAVDVRVVVDQLSR
ncbi:MAG: hypothetical protein KM310_08220 [Clostridiales bacterium]|nr:hypothetical protein [Clostridiales bacterium]